MSHAIKFVTGKKRNLNHNPRTFFTFSMFTEYNTVPTHQFKTYYREYRGRPPIVKSNTTRRKFYEAARVSRETVFVRGWCEDDLSRGFSTRLFPGKQETDEQF